MQEAVNELSKTLEGADFEAIKAAQDKVSQIASEAGGAMYAAAQASGEGVPQPEGFGEGPDFSKSSAADAGDDSVVDAEVVDEGPEEGSK